MYGGDEPSTPSQQHASREVYVGEDLPPRSNSTRKKKSKESTPTINEPVRSASVTADDIEAAFDAINDYRTSTKEHDFSSPDSLFGLSTIKETTDNEDTPFTGRPTKRNNFRDEDSDDIDFDNCFDQYKQKQEQQDKLRQEQEAKEREEQQKQQQQQARQKQHEQHLKQKQQELESKKKQRLEDEAAERRLIEENQRKAAAAAEAKKESKRAAPEPPRPSTVTIVTPKIETPATPVASKNDTSLSQLDDSNDSIDEDVDELLGKLEVRDDLLFSRTYTHTSIHPNVER